MAVHVIRGDCRDVLAGMASESVHCVVTSPPYWGLREYGIPPSIWGGEAGCGHEWREQLQNIDNNNGSHGGTWEGGSILSDKGSRYSRTQSAFCHCGAWRGALGLEPTIDLYVAHMVEVFRAVWRVLRKDGTLLLNLGDSYAGSWGAQSRGAAPSDKSTLRGNGHFGGGPKLHSMSAVQIAAAPQGTRTGSADRFPGLKPKDMCAIPWRVGLALQADGWWLRQDIIWSKPNPMPESVTDRCTKAHEYVLLLSKSARYFWDAEAIRDSPTGRTDAITSFGRPIERKDNGRRFELDALVGRNKRSVWEIATAPFAAAHFATFPPALVEPCILAGTSAKGCCAACGAPWVRNVERSFSPSSGAGSRNKGLDASNGWNDFPRGMTAVQTLGWSPSCACGAAVVPAMVLDPFGGAGTVGLVADRLQRDAILIELNDSYAAMARSRIGNDAPLFVRIAAE